MSERFINFLSKRIHGIKSARKASDTSVYIEFDHAPSKLFVFDPNTTNLDKIDEISDYMDKYEPDATPIPLLKEVTNVSQVYGKTINQELTVVHSNGKQESLESYANKQQKAPQGVETTKKGA